MRGERRRRSRSGGRGLPLWKLGARKSNCAASGSAFRANGARTVTSRCDCQQPEPSFCERLRRCLPRRQGPPRLCDSQSLPVPGSSLLGAAPPTARRSVAAGCLPERNRFRGWSPFRLRAAGTPRLRRLLRGAVWSWVICAIGFLLFSQTLPYHFLLLCLPTQVFLII